MRRQLFFLYVFVSLLSSKNVSSQTSNANFTSGNLLVVRIGDGVSNLSANAEKIYLDEYTPNGVLVNTVEIPAVANGGNHAFVIGGSSATSHGAGNLSPNGQYLALSGYDAAIGTSLTTLQNVATPRVFAIISNGTTQPIINTTTRVTIGNGDNRSAITTNGNSIWFGGTSQGVQYTTLGSTTSVQVSATPSPTRGTVSIFNGQLYQSTNYNPYRIAKIGSGLPTSSATVTPIEGIPATGTNAPAEHAACGYVFFDVDPDIPGNDLLYFVSELGGGNLQKYKYDVNSSKWVNIGSSSGGLLTSVRGLTGSLENDVPVLYGVGADKIIKIVDNAAYFGDTLAVNISLVQSAVSGKTAFRGLTFTPGSTLTYISNKGFIPPTANANFKPDNLLVTRIGDGIATLSANAEKVYLDEYTPNGVLVNTVEIPAIASGANHAFVIGGSSATSHGAGNLSPNGQYLALPGYDAAVGTSLATLQNVSTPRVFAVINNGTTQPVINTTTAVTIGNSDNRSAVTTDGNSIWFGGTSQGVQYTTLGSTTSVQVSATPSPTRGTVSIFNGQLYQSTNQNPYRIAGIGNGLPTSLTTATAISGIPATGTNAPAEHAACGYVFFDVDPNIPGNDLLYFVSELGSGDLQKYKYDAANSTWVNIGSVSGGHLASVRGLTGSLVNGVPVLYGVGGSKIIKITDNAAYGNTLSATITLLKSAEVKTAFKGLTLTPGTVAQYTNHNNLHYTFSGTKQDLRNWTFTPDAAWTVNNVTSLDGNGSLAAQASSTSSTYTAVLPFRLNLTEDRIIRVGCWVKTENIPYGRDAIATVQIAGTNYSQTMSEFKSHSEGFNYLEKDLKIPAGTENLRLILRLNATEGKAFFDEIKITDITDSLSNGSSNFNPYGVEKVPVSGGASWLANLPYRIIGNINTGNGDEPVWADFDYSRLLLAAGERNPVNPDSIRVFARMSNGQGIECKAVLSDPVSNLADHYNRNGTLKWRSVNGAVKYEIYFDIAGAEGQVYFSEMPNLGVGELLHYPENENNLLWAGWPGAGLEVIDVDGDGDFDIYGQTSDSGIWLHRNIGTNASPLFLPRSRPLENDIKPTYFPADLYFDWDGDGHQDRIYYVRPTRTDRYDNIPSTIYVQLYRNGSFIAGQPLKDSSGNNVVFENSTWFSLKAGDFNNDGKIDLVAGTANSAAEVMLNMGLVNDKPTAQLTKLPFNLYASDATLSGGMSLKPFPIDWNADGKTDIVFTSWQGFYWISMNKGVNNTFDFDDPVYLYQKGGIMVHDDSSSPYTVDWDDDGDLDIISGGADGNLMYFENVGTRSVPKFKGGVFVTDENGERFYVNAVESGGTVQGLEEQYWGYLTCVPVDVDHDGDIDLIISDSMGRVRWIENIGTRQNPVMSSAIHNFIVNGDPFITPWRNRPGVADWNNDGRLELIVVNDTIVSSRSKLIFYSQSATNPSVLIRGTELKDQNNNAVTVVNYSHPGGNGRTQIEVGDWDSDGKLDLIIGHPRTFITANGITGGNLLLFKNTGTNVNPVFETGVLPIRGDARFVIHDAWHCTYPNMVDWNNDGLPDLLTGTETGRFALYFNDYFVGDEYPVFTAENFEFQGEQDSVFQVLDFNNLDAYTTGLNTQNIQLQLLEEEALIAANKTLPITLTSFTGKVSGNYVDLEWKAITEQNGSYFDVLRSSDGTVFSGIGKVQGKAEQHTDYTFRDEAPLNGITYYRLRLVDENAKQSLSGIISVKRGVLKSENIIASASITSQQVSVKLYYSKSTPTKATVYDISGKLLGEKNLTIYEGENLFNIPVRGMYGNSVYVLVLNADGEIISKKFMPVK
ncbi:FG-GAP-like repeat-containing protein [Pseudopedobacter beijingensis]|uniref:FG-GAP-like repeat-containing protein n=1 Tax=Pseudopedobacter beijingensis TaxID=1207056 RepID=A0ABW4IHJ4_9SPHI